MTNTGPSSSATGRNQPSEPSGSVQDSRGNNNPSIQVNQPRASGNSPSTLSVIQQLGDIDPVDYGESADEMAVDSHVGAMPAQQATEEITPNVQPVAVVPTNMGANVPVSQGNQPSWRSILDAEMSAANRRSMGVQEYRIPEESFVPPYLAKAVKRLGLLSANRYLLPHLWERTVFLDCRKTNGHRVATSHYLADKLPRPDYESADFRRHVDVFCDTIPRRDAQFWVPMALERQARLSYAGISIPSGTSLDVAWVRRVDELEIAQWCSSTDFFNLLASIEDFYQSLGVSRAVLGPVSSLAPCRKVPWEQYYIGGEQALFPPCPVVYRDIHGEQKLILSDEVVNREGSFVDYETENRTLKEQFPDYVPASWRRQERNDRHRYGGFFPYHATELPLLDRGQIRPYYFCLPDWWHVVEVPYGFHNPLPSILTYLNEKFRLFPKHHGFRVLLRTQWALSVATHLIYEARGGRLWWIPPVVRQDIRTLGLHEPEGALVDNDYEKGCCRQLGKLLELIDKIAWSKLPRDGTIPEYPATPGFDVTGGLWPNSRKYNDYTPVHKRADWVLFDSNKWCVHLPPGYFVSTPEVPRTDRVTAREYEQLWDNPNVQPSSAPYVASVMPSQVNVATTPVGVGNEPVLVPGAQGLMAPPSSSLAPSRTASSMLPESIATASGSRVARLNRTPSTLPGSYTPSPPAASMGEASPAIHGRIARRRGVSDVKSRVLEMLRQAGITADEFLASLGSGSGQNDATNTARRAPRGGDRQD